MIVLLIVQEHFVKKGKMQYENFPKGGRGTCTVPYSCKKCLVSRIGQIRLPKMQTEEMVPPNKNQILLTNQRSNTQLQTQQKIYKHSRQTLPHMSTPQHRELHVTVAQLLKHD